jgi:uracil phosphoribosyltransferase
MHLLRQVEQELLARTAAVAVVQILRAGLLQVPMVVAAVAEAMAPTTRNRISPMEMLGKLGVTL